MQYDMSPHWPEVERMIKCFDSTVLLNQRLLLWLLIDSKTLQITEKRSFTLCMVWCALLIQQMQLCDHFDSFFPF